MWFKAVKTTSNDIMIFSVLSCFDSSPSAGFAEFDAAHRQHRLPVPNSGFVARRNFAREFKHRLKFHMNSDIAHTSSFRARSTRLTCSRKA